MGEGHNVFDEKHGRNLVRAQIGDPVLYRVFNVVFALLFAAIVALIVFANTRTFYKFSAVWIVAAAALGVLVSFFVAKLFQRFSEPSKKAEITIISVMFLIFVALQAYVAAELMVNPTATWDFGLVYTYARDWVVEGVLPDDYFLRCANNTGLYALFCGFFSFLHLFGMQDFTVPCVILNILAIDGALLLLYFSGRRVFGAKRSVLLLLAAFCTVPFLLYVPVYYTDTLTLPFPIACVFLWMKARADWRGRNLRGAVVKFLVISALAAVGAYIKMSVIIVWVAIALDLLILLCGKARIRTMLAGAAVCAAVLFGCTFGVRNSPLLPQYNYDDGVPLSMWMMMGLNSYGGYNDDDFQATLQYEGKAARAQFIQAEIGERLSAMGVGVVGHLADKLSFTYGDGTYFTTMKLDRSPAKASWLHDIVIFSGPYFKWFAYITFAAQAAMLVWCIVGAVKSFLRKNNAITFVRVALFGLTLFLMIWETRSRYLVNFLPLFLLCAMEAVPMPRPERIRVASGPGLRAGAGGDEVGPGYVPQGAGVAPDDVDGTEAFADELVQSAQVDGARLSQWEQATWATNGGQRWARLEEEIGDMPQQVPDDDVEDEQWDFDDYTADYAADEEPLWRQQELAEAITTEDAGFEGEPLFAEEPLAQAQGAEEVAGLSAAVAEPEPESGLELPETEKRAEAGQAKGAQAKPGLQEHAADEENSDGFLFKPVFHVDDDAAVPEILWQEPENPAGGAGAGGAGRRHGGQIDVQELIDSLRKTKKSAAGSADAKAGQPWQAETPSEDAPAAEAGTAENDANATDPADPAATRLVYDLDEPLPAPDIASGQAPATLAQVGPAPKEEESPETAERSEAKSLWDML